MTNCEKMSQASLYHDGVLDEEARTAFREHLASCTACANALRDFDRISNVLDRDRAPLFDSDLEERRFRIGIHESITRGATRGRERSMAMLLAPAAMWLISVASFGWYYFNEQQSADAIAEDWMNHMITEPVSIDAELEGAVDERLEFAQWMNRALSEEFSSD